MQDNRTPKIIVGSLVSATRDMGICRTEESGVCYEVYELENRPGYSFIFQRGGYDGFSPDDVNRFLEVSGVVSNTVAGYQFKNVGQLQADWRSGRFSEAFDEQNIRSAMERSAVPPLRDVLRREYDENLKREAAGIEPRRGPDFDMDR